MLRLPNEIALHCCSYLPPSDIYGLRTLISPLRGVDGFAHRIDTIREWFPRPMIDAMGGMQRFLAYPILEWRDDFMGLTDYIDRIRPSDLSEPIMIGRDGCGRSFIALRLLEYDTEFVVALFQRYTDDPGTWTHGRRGRRSIIQGCGCFLLRGRWTDENIGDVLSKLSGSGKVIIGEVAYTLAF